MTADDTVIPFSKKRQRKATADKPAPWLSHCISGSSGQPLPVLANALTALRSDPQLNACFDFDEMQDAAILAAPLPGQGQIFRRQVVDGDLNMLQEYLQRQGLSRIAQDMVGQAVDMRPGRTHSIRCAST